jgi:hypothetical protein
MIIDSRKIIKSRDDCSIEKLICNYYVGKCVGIGMRTYDVVGAYAEFVHENRYRSILLTLYLEYPLRNVGNYGHETGIGCLTEKFNVDLYQDNGWNRLVKKNLGVYAKLPEEINVILEDDE